MRCYLNGVDITDQVVLTRIPNFGGTHMTQYKDRLEAGVYAPIPTPEDLEQQTLADLKDQLAARGLPTSGNKAELVERLATSNEPTESDNTDDTA